MVNATIGSNSATTSELTTFISKAPDLYHNSLTIVAAISALGWDMFLTFEEERIYIWSRSGKVIKYLFLVVRYLSLITQIVPIIFLFASRPFSNQACSGFKWFDGTGFLVLLAAADILLVNRVFAFCGRNRYFLYFLIALYTSVYTTVFTLLFTSLPDYQEIANPFPQLRFPLGNCLVLAPPHKFLFVWPVLLIFQSTLFFCIVFRVIYTRYEAWKLGLPLSPLLIVFIRDGVWAYFLIVLNLLLCVIYTDQESPLASSLFSWLITTTSVCCCRLVLNLRGVYNQPQTDYHPSPPRLPLKKLVNLRIDVETEEHSTV